MILHPKAVLRALYYGQRWRLKRFLKISDRPRSPVLEAGIDQAIQRYRRICQTLIQYVPKSLPANFSIAEIGCGDCLAAADMFLGLGAQHVHLIEHQALPITELHRLALEEMKHFRLPNRTQILLSGNPPKLNPEYATLHTGLMEHVVLPSPVDLVYSFDVLEHVEDLDGFFSSCYRILKRGGFAIHKFDLSGHEFFEDPIPPLDFQTYPRWLYRLMFPKYRRAVGNFADRFFDSMRKNGFEILNVAPLNCADSSYLKMIRPRLRKAAQKKQDDILGFLDLVVSARST